MKKALIAIGLAFCLSLCLAGQALSQETNHGCVKNSNGSLRIVGSPDDCRRNERYLPLTMAGTPGPPGEPGPQGDPGPQGEQGEPGAPCWDLNQDGECSEGEDQDGNGECEVLDCQGPSGPGSILVYDDNEQFIGILVELLLGNDDQWFTRSRVNNFGVFMPGIKKFAQINLLEEGYLRIVTDLLYFQGYDCSGQPYWPHNNNFIHRWRGGALNEYFVYYTGGSLLVPDGQDWFEWSTLDVEGNCTNNEPGRPLNIPLWEPVEVPISALPFVPPLIGPPDFR